jgi:hypothetical protein
VEDHDLELPLHIEGNYLNEIRFFLKGKGYSRSDIRRVMSERQFEIMEFYKNYRGKRQDIIIRMPEGDYLYKDAYPGLLKETISKLNSDDFDRKNWIEESEFVYIEDWYKPRTGTYFIKPDTDFVFKVCNENWEFTDGYANGKKIHDRHGKLVGFYSV